jgi:imidazolonepropionase-like amidohydrolase
MFRWAPALAVLFAASLLTATLVQAAAPPTVAYIHGRWWTGDRFEEGARYVRGALFVARPAQAPRRTVDLSGAYVIPPFGDAHNHMPGRAADVSARAMGAGVFYLMNPTILASAAPALREALKGPGKVDAVLSMGAITAPGGHPEALYVDVLRPRVYPDIPADKFLGDAFHHVTKLSDIGPVLDRLQAQGAEFVKIMVLNSEEYAKRRDDPASRGFKGLDPTLVAPLVADAHRRGLRVAAHIETAADFRVIVAAGVDESAHMPGYYGAKDALDRYAITDEDAAAAARSHIVMVATASLAADNNQGHPERLAEVQALQRANLLKLKRAGAPLLIGTDGQPDDAPNEARYLIGLGVFTPKDALVSLTESTPRYILPGRRVGRLQPGYEASFLTLAADPTRDFDAIKTITRRVKQGFEIPGPSAPSPSRPTLAIAHVAVISMRGAAVARDRTILISGGRIAAIGRNLRIPPGVRTLDGRGRYAIPGLWDMHVRVLSGVSAETTQARLAAMLRAGVVGVRDMGSTLGELRAFRSAPPPPGVAVAEVVAAGSVVNGPATRWSRPNELHVSKPEEAEPAVAELSDAGAQFVKVYSGLDPASYAAVVAAAHRRGLVVAGHLPLSIDLDTAVAAGQRSIEHMEVTLSKSCGSEAPAKAANLWISALAEDGVGARQVEELSLRARRDPARCAAVLRRMAAKPIWWTPTLVLDFADGSFRDGDFLRFADPGKAGDCDAAEFAKLPAEVRRHALQAELDDVATIHAAGVRLLAGTDMPTPCEVPVASLWRELGLFVRAGLSPYQALRTATVEPAAYLGRPDAGVLAPGAIADIVLLKANPLKDIAAVRTVGQVVKAGVVVDTGGLGA